jgi:hypothetical protein
MPQNHGVGPVLITETNRMPVGNPKPIRKPAGAMGCLLFAIANTLTTYGVRPTIIKDHLEASADLAYDRWNSFSRITVAQSDTGPPTMWGPSPRLPPSTIEHRSLTIDGGAGNADPASERTPLSPMLPSVTPRVWLIRRTCSAVSDNQRHYGLEPGLNPNQAAGSATGRRLQPQGS